MDAGGSVRLMVTGSLALYETALRAELTRVGYAPVSVTAESVRSGRIVSPTRLGVFRECDAAMRHTYPTGG
jgi:hypothetical protein